MMNNMSFQLISNIFNAFSFERDRRMEGQTEPLIEGLWRTWESSWYISESFPVILEIFNSSVADRPTDQQTELVIEVLWRT